MVQENVTGTPGSPIQDASAASSQQSAIDYETLAKVLEPRLAALVDKQWQSGKDKRIAKLQGKVDGFEAELARYAELTGQPLDQNALRNLKIEKLLAQQSGEPGGEVAVSEATGTRKADTPSVDEETLAAMGLDAKSAEVVALLQREAPFKEFVALANAKRSVPVASPASVLSSPAGVAQTETLESLTAELETLMRDPRKNWKKIEEVGARQKALLPKA